MAARRCGLAVAAGLLIASAAGGPHAAAVQDGELQLFGGNTDSGRLGLYHAGQWGAVCSGSWGLAEAAVACRTLGFETSFQAMAMPAPAATPVWLSSVSCAGNESSLLDCSARHWQPGNCSGADGVGVSCLASGIGAPDTDEVSTIISSSLARLRSEFVPDAPLAPAGVAAASACEIASSVPLPFGDAGGSYVFADQLAPFFAAQDARLRSQLCDVGTGAELQADLLAWTKKGLLVNSFGVDPTALFGDAVPPWAPGIPTRVPAGLSSRSIAGEALPRLRLAYLAGDDLQGLHWQIDRRGEPRGELPPPADLRTRQLLDTLHHEGFVTLEADDLGLDLPHLQAEAKALLAAGSNRSVVSVTNLGAVRSARGKLGALEPMLRSRRVSAIARGYLGNHTILHGYKVRHSYSVYTCRRLIDLYAVCLMCIYIAGD